MDHAVALVPGFLGFEHDGALTYFADRLVAGLRAGLAGRNHMRIPVVPVPTLPVGSLAARQRKLIDDLAKLDARLGGGRAWHLVGHSTGGLDAAMLLRTQGLVDGKDGSTFGDKPPDMKGLTISSVVTIAAPHYGTGLARALESRFAKVGHGLRLLADVFGPGHGDLRPRLAFFAAGARASALDFAFHDALATDLLPTVASRLTRAANRSGRLLYSIATCAPPPDESVDPMFRDLFAWTSNDRDEPPPAVPHDNAAWVTSGERLALDASSNDGVVNTLRQLDGNVMAFVLGDHADVIGRYQRRSLVDGKTFDGGLLTSGAKFDDDQFFDLIDIVASCLDGAIHAT